MRKQLTDGGVNIFVNCRRNAIKLLKWDHDGLAIYHKRLERGLFEIHVTSSDGRHMHIGSEQLSSILHGIRLSSVVRNKRFTLRSKGYSQRVDEGLKKR